MMFQFLRKSKATIPLILLLIYSALIPMQLSNYVLCIGEDGHVEFEFAVNGCCAKVHPHDLGHTEATFTEVPIADEDHCGECVDIPIFTSLNSELYIVSAQEIEATDSPISTISRITPKTCISNIINQSPHLPISLLFNPTLILLRTVILLI